MCWPTRTTSRNDGNGFRPGPGEGWNRRPPAGDVADGAGWASELHSATVWLPYSFRGCHLLSHRTASRSVTPNSRGPSHTPSADKRSDRQRSSAACLRANVPPAHRDRRSGGILRVRGRHPGPVAAFSARGARGPRLPRSASGWTDEQLAHGGLGRRRRRPTARASTIRAWWPREASVGPVAAGDGPPETCRAADTMPERCSSMRLPAAWISRAWNSASAREKVMRVALAHRVPHDLDHVAEALLDVLAPVAGGQPGGERLDGPAQLVQLAALVIALRTEGAPFDDVGVEQVPVTDRADPGAHVGPGADQALGLEDAQGLADDGAGDLESLADLLRNERPVGAEVTGNDHLAELLDELAVKSTAPAGRPRRPTRPRSASAPSQERRRGTRRRPGPPRTGSGRVRPGRRGRSRRSGRRSSWCAQGYSRILCRRGSHGP